MTKEEIEELFETPSLLLTYWIRQEIERVVWSLSSKGFTVVVYFNRVKQGDIEIEISKGSKGIGFYKIESLDDIQKVYKEVEE